MAQHATGTLNINGSQASAAAQGIPRGCELGVRLGHITDNAGQLAK